jgi:hypothetical protein
VNEIAQEVDPQAKVVYVDYDPDVVTRAQELLGDARLVRAMLGDARDPETVMGDGCGGRCWMVLCASASCRSCSGWTTKPPTHAMRGLLRHAAVR